MLAMQSRLLLPLLVTLAGLSLGNPLQPRVVTHASELISIAASREPPNLHTSEFNTAMTKRTGRNTPMISCKEVWRHQQYAVMPTVLGVATLHAFWSELQFRSVYDEYFDNLGPYFTITQGALQATFSCLGQAVPWDFVHDFAKNAAESVVQGWLETFDAVYEQEATGVTMWVSLRVVQGLHAKRKRPG